MWRFRFGGSRRHGLLRLIATVVGLLAVYFLSGGFGARDKPAGPDRGLAGPARVVDGDTLELRGEKLRLQGIDAPELAQTCEAKGQPVACGKLAAEHLDDLIGARTLSCAVKGRDRYGRGLARCEASGRDVAEAMARDNWAVADRRYSKGRYEHAEAAARESRRGVWAMRFEDPAKWRARHRGAS